MRKQIEVIKRFDSHYQILGANRHAIQIIDEQIEAVLQRKSCLIQRYGQMTMNEASTLLQNEAALDQQKAYELFKKEAELQMRHFDKEIAKLQMQRSFLWDTHYDIQYYLLAQENEQNKKLTILFQKQSLLLEKIYLRQMDILTNSSVALAMVKEFRLYGLITSLIKRILKPSRAMLTKLQQEARYRSDVLSFEAQVNTVLELSETGFEDSIMLSA